VSINETMPEWHKSSTSGTGDCVEWAFVDDDVLVRNSNHPGAGTTVFTRSEWNAFLTGVKNGEADLPG
jgi:hypothetical protein